METASGGPETRWRPRFSLLNLLSLMTVVALSIALAISSRRLNRAEQELDARRIESGQVSVTDPLRIYAVSVYTGKPLTWRWRIYLPTSIRGNYFLNCYSGRHTPIKGTNLNEWFNSKPGVGVMDWSGSKELAKLPKGEITIEAKLIQEDGQWYINVAPLGRRRLRVKDDWLSRSHRPRVLNGLPVARQANLHRGDQVSLLLIQGDPYTYHVRYQGRNLKNVGVADSVFLWISKDDRSKRPPTRSGIDEFKDAVKNADRALLP